MWNRTNAARRVITGLLVFGLLLEAGQPVPRPAKDYTFKLLDGSTKKLSSLKGKVVVMEFLFTWCTTCQGEARMLSGLQNELGPKGLQVMGVAFNPEVNTKDEVVNKATALEFDEKYADFPVAKAPEAEVLGYLGISVMERYGAPQLVVIDKEGIVRAQTKAMPGQNLRNETYLKNLLIRLLAE